MPDNHWQHWAEVANDEERKQNTGFIKQLKFKSILESNCLEKKPLRILSIGPGDGALDEILIKKSQLEVSLYYAVDPVVTEYHSKLKEMVHSWKIPYVIEKRSFSENYSMPQNAMVTMVDGSTEPLKKVYGESQIGDDGKHGLSAEVIEENVGIFDVVLMASVLYYVHHPGLVIQNARSLLRRDGQIIIFNQTDEVGAELFSCMSQSSSEEFREKTKGSNYAMSHLQITNELDGLGIAYKCEIDKNEILCYDVTDYLDGGDPIPYFSFQTQKPFSEWTEVQKKGIFEIVKKRSFVNDKGRCLLPEDIATIVVSSPN